jgi:cytochrome c oxidase subunit 3
VDGPRGGTGVLAPPKDVHRPRRAAPPRTPPGDGDDSGGGDRQRFGGEGDERSPEGAGSLGLALALAGIATFFVVLVAVWLFLRRHERDWPPEGGWTPPHALWISTLLLAASSALVERAARLARAPTWRPALLRTLAAGFVLGLAFLGAQVFLWRTLWRDGLLPSTSGYGAVFYALTGLHGLHVAGGLVYLARVGLDLFAPEAFLRRRHGVRLAATYWHFMGALWLVLFTLLYFVG